MIPRLIYKLIYRREPPPQMNLNYGLFHLIWKFIRKTINVVIAPNMPFTRLRILLYRLVGYKIGKNSFIGMGCYLDDRHPEMLIIGDRCVISYCCKFAAHSISHPPAPIVIEDDAYIGVGSVILSAADGTTIGKGALIGAMTLVNKSIPPGKIAVGVPARILADVTDEMRENMVF